MNIYRILNKRVGPGGRLQYLIKNESFQKRKENNLYNLYNFKNGNSKTEPIERKSMNLIGNISIYWFLNHLKILEDVLISARSMVKNLGTRHDCNSYCNTIWINQPIEDAENSYHIVLLLIFTFLNLFLFEWFD